MSNTIYIEYAFVVHPLQPTTDILIAELGELGFESFVENESGVQAYIQKAEWYEDIVDGIQLLDNPNFSIDFQIKEIAQENWNATWEHNFDPIRIDDRCEVRAPFHPRSDVEYDIVIEPKMSFGTGHHETTHMMLQHILDHDMKHVSVLDMGCGTGVLAILASMKGAARVDAIDIDNWCYLNAMENIERNNCDTIKVYEGDAALLGKNRYDVILANINRNILLEDIHIYAKCLAKKGVLFLSGFYTEDLEKITEKCGEQGLTYEKNLKNNNWVAVKYVT